MERATFGYLTTNLSCRLMERAERLPPLPYADSIQQQQNTSDLERPGRSSIISTSKQSQTRR